jgi:hypothetical protein
MILAEVVGAFTCLEYMRRRPVFSFGHEPQLREEQLTADQTHNTSHARGY